MSQEFYSFDVPGRPVPAGSKRAFPIRRRNGSMGVAVSDDSGKKGKVWRETLQAVVARQYHGAPIDQPIRLEVVFRLARPKSHYRTGRHSGTIKPTAPRYPITRPDTTKLLRAVEDALTGLVWRDDSQVVSQTAHKIYDARPGVTIRVITFPEDLDHGESTPRTETAVA